MKRYIGVILLMGVSFTMAHAQFYEEKVARKAMEDELQENLKNLRMKDSPDPFFISYTVMDGMNTSISSSLGATLSATQLPAKGYNVRLLVGSYEFNDESFDGESDRSQGFTQIQLPVETDYYGIRRALWASTDLVYKSASKLYKGHQAQVKNVGKPLSEIPHRKFSKVPVVDISDKTSLDYPDVAKLEKYANELSGVFTEYSNIDFSAVNVNAYSENNYFVSSEGSYIKQATNIITVRVYALARTEDGQPLINQLNFTASSFDGLPKLEKARADIKAMADELIALFTVPALQDSYYGPVLFIGEAAGSFFANTIDLNPGGLQDADFIPSSKSYLYGAGNPAEMKPGKKVAAESITIKAMSTLKEFEGQKLIGAFLADNEGVVPPDELVLVEHGVVKNLLGNRTITKDDQASTGHASGVGVLMINDENTMSMDGLKKDLIRVAKEEGMDHALIVRDANFGTMPIFNVYSVSVADGSETFVKSALLRELDMRTLRKVVASSADKIVYNAYNLNNGTTPTSIISPSAVLIEEMEIERGSNPSFSSTTYVESPLSDN